MTSNIPQNDRTLIHLAEQKDTSGAVERRLLGKLEEVKLQPECGHRHGKRLPENTSELCVQRLITARPGARQGRLLARHRRAESCIVQAPLVPLERRSHHQQPQPGLLPLGMLVFHLFGVQSPDSRQDPDPLGKPRPDLGALHAGDCGICVLKGSDARHRWS